MSTKPNNDGTNDGAQDEYKYHFEPQTNFPATVSIDAEDEEDARKQLAEMRWWEVGVEDVSGAWDHVSVPAVTEEEEAMERGVEKAEEKPFNKIDSGSAYQAVPLAHVLKLRK